MKHRRHVMVGVLATVCALVMSACNTPLGIVGDDGAPVPSRTAPTAFAANRTAPEAAQTPQGRDLALPPSRDQSPVLQQQDDGSAPLGQKVTVPSLPFSFSRDGYTFRDLHGAQVPLITGRVTPKVDTGPHDTHGVRMFVVDGKMYDHPNFQANYGIENLESYDRTHDEFYLNRAKLQAQRLIDRRVESRGAWFYPYPFDFRLHGNVAETVRAPWYSGLSQGKVLSLMSRLAATTHEAKWAEAADRTFNSFLLPPDEQAPWVVSVGSDRLLWFVEYPFGSPDTSDLVFNGHMSAVFGLWDYYRVTKRPQALALYDGGITTINRYRSTLRVPQAQSIYCVTHHATATNGYHKIHIAQLIQLWLMTGRNEFVQLADAMAADNPYPVLDTPRTVDLPAGRHIGYNFDVATGAVLGSKTVTLTEATTATTIRRMRVKGRGVYYRMTKGSVLEGLWVPEKAGLSLMRGPIQILEYHANREGVLPAKRAYVGTKYDVEGEVSGRTKLTPRAATQVSYDAKAWIGGVPSIHVTGGRLSGYWIAAASLQPAS
ncbi:D-glucuronyl C5-epimerase family protein [Actinopolymorpha pittospori]